MLATASHAIVVGFNVQADAAARRNAEAEGVSIRLYNIIYRLTEDIEKAMKGLLEPEIKENIIGTGVVLATFKISKVGAIAGCRVTSGEFRRNAKVRLRREGTIIFEGEFSSLKHEKEDVREVRNGFECGAGFRNYNDFAVGDQIECYVLEKATT
jgi:translation initiation factor IF-2